MEPIKSIKSLRCRLCMRAGGPAKYPQRFHFIYEAPGDFQTALKILNATGVTVSDDELERPVICGCCRFIVDAMDSFKRLCQKVNTLLIDNNTKLDIELSFPNHSLIECRNTIKKHYELLLEAEEKYKKRSRILKPRELPSHIEEPHKGKVINVLQIEKTDKVQVVKVESVAPVIVRKTYPPSKKPKLSISHTIFSPTATETDKRLELSSQTPSSESILVEEPSYTFPSAFAGEELPAFSVEFGTSSHDSVSSSAGQAIFKVSDKMVLRKKDETANKKYTANYMLEEAMDTSETKREEEEQEIEVIIKTEPEEIEPEPENESVQLVIKREPEDIEPELPTVDQITIKKEIEDNFEANIPPPFQNIQIKNEIFDENDAVKVPKVIATKSPLQIAEMRQNLQTKMQDMANKMKTKNTSINCDYCAQTFTCTPEMHRHLFDHAVRKSFPCRICGKVFVSGAKTIEHKRLAHNVTKRDGRIFKCSACDTKYDTLRSLKDHCVSMHKKKTY